MTRGKRQFISLAEKRRFEAACRKDFRETKRMVHAKGHRELGWIVIAIMVGMILAAAFLT